MTPFRRQKGSGPYLHLQPWLYCLDCRELNDICSDMRRAVFLGTIHLRYLGRAAVLIQFYFLKNGGEKDTKWNINYILCFILLCFRRKSLVQKWCRNRKKKPQKNKTTEKKTETEKNLGFFCLWIGWIELNKFRDLVCLLDFLFTFFFLLNSWEKIPVTIVGTHLLRRDNLK